MKNFKWKNQLSIMTMIIITCAVQVLTLMKSSLVAGSFGTSMEMDAYNFANNIVSFIFGFVASGITTIIIPCYVEKERKHVDAFITLIYLILIACIGAIIIFRFNIVGVMSNKGEVYINIACNVLSILLLVNLMVSVTDITAAYFQCIDRYNLPKVINFFSQVVVVILLIVLKNITIIQYTLVISLGIVINCVFDVFFAKKNGWKYRVRFDFLDPGVVKLVKQFLPILFSSGVYRISLMIDALIASRLDTGRLTILSYSNQIAGMVNTVFIGTLLTYYYPKIVRKISSDENGQTYFWGQTFFFHALIGLLIAGFACVGKDAVSLLFEHGKFDAKSTMGVFMGTLLYIIGQQTNVIRDLIYRYFYAHKETKVAALNSIIVTVVNISASIFLVFVIGYYGIIIGTILASFVSLFIIMFKYKKRFGFEIKFTKIVFPYIKNLSISFITILIVLITKNTFTLTNQLLRIGVYGFETVLIYLVLIAVFNKTVVKAFKNI